MKRTKLKAKKSTSGDFAKKKKKVGKAKSAAENATDTTFKSRSVVILPQLEQSDEPTSRRKLPLQAMLNQLSHHNVSTRRNALSGLEEFFTEHPALLLPNLGKVVESASVALTDQEPVVRRAFHSLLKHVLAGVASDQLQPFVQLLVAHLSCAFTHIADEIQMDAMKAFQVLLEHHPRLLVVHAPKLLSHLVHLLSRRGSPSSVKAASYSSSQVAAPASSVALASNPSSKLSLQASRAEVFGQLCRFFKLLLSTVKGSAPDGYLRGGRQSAPVVDVAGRKVFEIVGSTFQVVRPELCDLTGPTPCVAVLRNSGIRIPDAVSANGGIGQVTLGSKSNLFFSSHEELWHFVQTLFSLLLECWLECNPSRLTVANASIKPVELGLMETVVNLLCIVVEVASAVDAAQQEASLPLAGHPKLVEKLGVAFFSELERHMLGHFPFLCPPGGRGVLMNLTACKTFLLLLKGAHLSSAPSFFESACTYLASLADCIEMIAGSSHIMAPCIQCVVDIVPVFVQLGSLWQGGGAAGMEEEILTGFRSLYDATCSLSSSKHLLIACYERLLASELNAQRRSSLLMTKLLLPWLQELPNLLFELGGSNPETSAIVADTLASAAVFGVNVHIEPMRKNLRLIFGSQVGLAQLPAFVQRKVVELLWHVPELGIDDLAAVSRCVLSGKLDLPTALYLIQLIHLKLVGLGNEGSSSASFIALDLSFILTIIVGYSREQLNSFHSQMQQNQTMSDGPVLVKPGADCDIWYRMSTLKCASEYLRSSSFSDQVLTLVQAGLLELMSLRCLPYDAAVGVLTLFAWFVPSRGTIPDPLVASVGKLCYTVITDSLSTSISLDTGHPWAPEGLKLTRQVLCSYEPIGHSLVQQFKHGIQAADSTQQGVLVQGLIQVLNDPSLNGVFRRIAGEVVKAVITITNTVCNEELKRKLEVAVQKYAG